MVTATKKNPEKFGELVSIMERLRSPEGCPWDREQSMDSLKTYLIEEVYEVLEAIEAGDPETLREELGDLLFHILFVSQIAQDEGKFDIWDVIAGASNKMVNRHPHVFGRKEVSSPKEVERTWSDLKEKEKTHRRSILDGIPQHLPALLMAYRITERASRVGFDWQKPSDVLSTLDEEIEELNQVLATGHPKQIHDEVGDILFSVVNLARLAGSNPEDALRKTTHKFIRRFRYIENALKRSGKTPKEASLEEMDRLWEEAKEKE